MLSSCLVGFEISYWFQSTNSNSRPAILGTPSTSPLSQKITRFQSHPANMKLNCTMDMNLPADKGQRNQGNYRNYVRKALGETGQT